jgi:hypothetical protein
MGTFKTIPQMGLAGLIVSSPASSWGTGSWTTLIQNCPAVSILGVTAQVTAIQSVDTTEEGVLELATGAVGSEVVKLQLPFSFRSDTAVGYYLTPLHLFLPEPFSIAANTRLAIRAYDSNSSSRNYHGIRLRIDEVTPFGPNPPGVEITQQALQRSAVM